MSKSSIVKKSLWVLSLTTSMAVTGVAAADEPPLDSNDGDRDTGAAHSFRPHFIGDLRAMMLIRSDNNYFAHANTYAYPMDPGAGGIELNLGAELLPRLSLLASAHYAIDGANRDSAQLRLQSGAVLAAVRWAFYRTGEGDFHFDATLQGGFGRYVIKETYLDPAISPQTYEKDDGAFGGTLGLQGSLTFSGFVAVAGYGFHYTPASIADRIGGSVSAGGHEFSIGIGVWL